MQNIVGNQLASQGFYETMTNSLTSPEYVNLDADLIKAIDTKSLNQAAKRPLKGGLLTNKIEEDLNINIYKLEASLIKIKSLFTQ